MNNYLSLMMLIMMMSGKFVNIENVSGYYKYYKYGDDE